MNGIAMIQLYLLSQMRARERVAVAMRQLGVDADALDAARAEAHARGLDSLGHAMSTYAALLGRAVLEVSTDGPDSYQRLAHRYRLPLWPEVLFSVFGSAEGQTGGVGFVAPQHVQATVPTRASALLPWRHTEDQLAPILARAKPLDEWYPQRDYECVLESSTGTLAPHVVRFDFNLLQEVVRS